MVDDSRWINVAFLVACLNRLKVLTALMETAGVWSDADHPEMATPQDVMRWLAELRASWRRVQKLSTLERGDRWNGTCS